MSNGQDQYTRPEWVQILRAASRIKSGDPDYNLAQQAVREALDYLNAEDVAAAETGPELGTGQAAALGFGQGASFGFADELAGALAAALAARGGGRVREKPGEAYRRARDVHRATLRQARGQHPIAATLGEAAGALAVPVPGAGKAKVFTTTGRLLPRVAKGAAIGAGAGGLYAAGSADAALPERLKATVTGAQWGAAFGGGIPLVAHPILLRIADRRAARELQRLRLERARARAQPKAAAPAAEQGVRATWQYRALLKQGFSPDDAERIAREAAEGVGPSPKPEPAAVQQPAARPAPTRPPVTAPAEEVAAAVPEARPAAPPPADLEMRVKRSETLPYYPRGGAREQAVAPRPAQATRPVTVWNAAEQPNEALLAAIERFGAESAIGRKAREVIEGRIAAARRGTPAPAGV